MLSMANMVCTLIAVTTPHRAIVDVNGTRIFTKPVKTTVYYCKLPEIKQNQTVGGLRYYVAR